MKRYFKIVLIFIFVFLVFSLNKHVEANSISKISMDIYIDDSGDASITEVWECNVSKGTEVYHPYYNLGNSKIQNLKVSENGTQYTTINRWNTSSSMKEKANKCGINEISNGVELCWGISSYGSHKYTVQYTVTNFVSELSDSQIIYWTLIPYDFSNPIGNVDIRIRANFLIEDTIDVWGYGNYGGLAYVDDGNIYMNSDGRLDTDEYMTILVRFPLNSFNCSNKLDYNFQHFYKMAEEGSVKYNQGVNPIYNKFVGIFATCFGLIGFIAIIYLAVLKDVGTDKEYGFKYGNTKGKIPRKVDYYRDIPCNKNIFKAYYIAYQYGIIKNRTDILGAIILKWLKEGKIRTENKAEVGVFRKDNTVVVLGNEANNQFESSKETELFGMLYKASKDGILENKEFEKWCEKHYDKILDWFSYILKEQRDNLVSEGLLTIEEEGKGWNGKYIATQELEDEAMKIAGFKRFLLEYTLINDREGIEVKLFEDYLVYAQFLGIANKVQKQFKKLYPDIIEQTNYNTYDNLVYINMWATGGISSASDARYAAQGYSSGGGGFSSGGGGGGSFGGGGGGRRIPLIVVTEKLLLFSLKIRMACLNVITI